MGKNLIHKKMYNYSKKMFTVSAKPIQITSVRISGVLLYISIKDELRTGVLVSP